MLSLITGGSITGHLEHANQPIELGLKRAKQSKGGAEYCQEGQGSVETQLSVH